MPSNKTLVFVIIITAILVSCDADKQVEELPDVFFSSPAKFSTFTVDETMIIKININDTKGLVDHLVLFMNDVEITNLNSSPFEYVHDLKGTTPGTYKLKATAIGNNGAESSNEISIYVNSALEVFTDSRDGNVYRYVTIGNQIWMAENLAWLPSVNPSSESSLSLPMYYVSGYEGNDVSEAKAHSSYSLYGVNYNWEAAIDCCPDGWSLPSDTDWRKLEEFVDNDKGPFNRTLAYPEPDISYYEGMGYHMRHTSGWGNIKGLNSYSFSALPGGGVPSINYTGNRCYGCTNEGSSEWWSSSVGSEKPITRGMPDGFPENFSTASEGKEIGLTVRCIKVQ